MNHARLGSMLCEYLHEGEGKSVVTSEYGFATYGFDCVPGVQVPHVYIQDLFVRARFRKSGVAAELADDVARIARERGVRKMLGSVSLSRKGAQANMEVLARYGMTPFAAHEGTVWFQKEI